MKRHEPEVPRLVFGVRRRELACDDVRFCLRLPDGHASLQPADETEPMEPPDLRIGVVERDRQKEIHRLGQTNEAVVRKRESGRHDTNDGVRAIVDDNRPPDDVGRGCKPVLPQPVADDDRGRTGGFVGRREISTDHGRDAERRHQVGAHAGRLHARGRARTSDGHARRTDRHRGEPFEDAVALSIVDEIRRRDGCGVGGPKRPVHPHERRLIAIGQRRQQDAVDDREHTRRRTDAERQRADDEAREQRLSESDPHRIPDVPPEIDEHARRAD